MQISAVSYHGTIGCILLVALTGCLHDTTQDAIAERDRGLQVTDEKSATAAIERNPEDPWAYYERGHIEEQRHDLDDAVSDYSMCVSLLPERKATRPALALGRTHLALDHLGPARRLLEEVVTTVPADSAVYVSNPDFREAALLLRTVYSRIKDPVAASRLRDRFLGEFGGKAQDWPE